MLPRGNLGRPFFLGPAPGGVRLVFFNLAYVLMCLLHAIVVVKGISITLVRMHRIRGTMYLFSRKWDMTMGVVIGLNISDVIYISYIS